MTERAAKTPPGAFVEVGVFQGGTAAHLYDLATEQGRPLYLYDTFCGIPCRDDIDNHYVGDFSNCDESVVRGLFPRAVVTSGFFPTSAVPMEPVAFVHLDCDQYRSYCESIDYLLPLMVSGSVMWFDDAPDMQGAFKAVTDRFGDRLQLSLGKYFVELE